MIGDNWLREDWKICRHGSNSKPENHEAIFEVVCVGKNLLLVVKINDFVWLLRMFARETREKDRYRPSWRQFRLYVKVKTAKGLLVGKMMAQLLHCKAAIEEHGSFFDMLEELELDELANDWSEDEFVDESPFVYVEDTDVNEVWKGVGIGPWAYTTHVFLYARFFKDATPGC
ncbi:hypothetical protein OF83DRAFT_1176857 [Amylostereum chailletii]|nr:hypothetical protein OF83DRAFT_1176857 [Amylostereum chailletii]